MNEYYDVNENGNRELCVVAVKNFDYSEKNRISAQDDADEIIDAMGTVGFVCRTPLVGYVTEPDIMETIESLLVDKQQAENDMFAMLISRRVDGNKKQ